MEMIRKQVYIEPEQERLLKQLSKQLGVTEAELIRRGIAALSQLQMHSVQLDDDLWQKELQYMKERAEKFPAVPGGKRTWKRDDLYDRPKYLSS
jgi:Ribbon-helix-helix domain